MRSVTPRQTWLVRAVRDLLAPALYEAVQLFLDGRVQAWLLVANQCLPQYWRVRRRTCTPFLPGLEAFQSDTSGS